jgi:hypothetical protein
MQDPGKQKITGSYHGTTRQVCTDPKATTVSRSADGHLSPEFIKAYFAT